MRSPVALFNDISEELRSDRQTCISNAMDELTGELREIRSSLSRDEWKRTIALGREHELRGLIHQDPFTQG